MPRLWAALPPEGRGFLLLKRHGHFLLLKKVIFLRISSKPAIFR
jgi:hypothetical protein